MNIRLKINRFLNVIRKGSRAIHRELSFFFAGVVMIYAISGLVMNHKKDFNSDYIVKQHQITIDGSFPKNKNDFTKEYVLSLLEPINEKSNYTQHYFLDDNQMKVFIKGGSSLVVNINTGGAVYESFKKRQIISSFNRLHYNPNRWWTVFADIFAVALMIITITGVIMIKGHKGLWGRGGIELLLGIIIPLLFIFNCVG